MIYERTFFPEVDDSNNLRDFFFLGTKIEIRITEFLKENLFELYPACKLYWENEMFDDFIHKYGIMYRESLMRGLKNITR